MSTRKNATKIAPKRQRNAKKEEEETKPTMKAKETKVKTKEEKTALKPKRATSKTQPTPSSSRVIKTQFFPSKRLYSTALGTEEQTKTREVKASTSKTKVSSPVSERPRTATLKKGTIINETYKVGPDIPNEPDYEDDFESYESDFDEYHSTDSISSTESRQVPKATNSGTDDERKLDSGNYELPDYKHTQILDNIKESIEKENANLASLSDEGFEDGKSLQFINFLGAQLKYKHRKSVERMHKRGEEILNMIKLDNFSFTLLDLSPVSYEVFIKNYGSTNTIQVSVQTGDNVNDETQTEEINTINKWTQFPIVIPKLEVPNEEIYRSNYLGVGTDEFSATKPEINVENLRKFLLNAGNLILNIQTESCFTTNNYNSTRIPFSTGYMLFDTQKQEILKNRTIIDICPTYFNKFLTIHDVKDAKSLVCLWNISNSTPEAIFSTFGQVTCCTFDENLVIAGLKDGNLVIWDDKKSNPVYMTGIGEGHYCPVVVIASFADFSVDLFEPNQTNRICSLDEDGDIIVWSLFKTSLIMNTKISLAKLYPEIGDFRCTHFAVNHLDPNHLYISTNYGCIIHCLANGGRLKKLQAEIPSQANFMETCPFSPLFLLVGFNDGNIKLYSRQIETPLFTLSDREYHERIEIVQWSQNRPFVFYTKDSRNIHVWDLKASDIFPVYSVPFKDDIVCMKVSPSVLQESYMVTATKDGLIYVYLLDNEGHGPQPMDKYQEDVKQFLNYINRHV